jgi:tetratricopeptide (TPR) repeat protein
MGIPGALTDRVRTGQGVLVAGLGFIDQPAARGWDLLLRRLAERLAAAEPKARDSARAILDMVNRGRYAPALAWLRRRLPEDAWKAVLADVLAPGGKTPESVLLAAQLPWRGVVATGFQDSWDRTLKNGRARRLDARTLADSVRGDNGFHAERSDGVGAAHPFLLHALGTLADPQSLCLTAGDLRRRPGMDAVAGFLRSLFAERSFIFIGFRPGDPDLRLILDHLLGAAPTRAEHYLVLPDSAEGESDLQSEILGAELDLVPVRFAGSLEDVLRGMQAGSNGVPDRLHSSRLDLDVPIEIRGESMPMAGLYDWVREQHAHIEATPPGERAALYERMGDVFRERLTNPVQAISYYRSAVGEEPGRRSALAKLRDLYTAHKHWSAAEEILVRLAQIEPLPEKRAQLLCHAASIALDELDRPVRAAQLLERALDEAPELREIFETLERLLNQEKNWQGLARLYQKMARELDADGPGRALKLRAMDGLAELGLRFSKDPKVALKALEAADVLDPGNADRKALMAGLYAQGGPEQHLKAVASHHAAIGTDPDRFTSYRALADLYRAAGDGDRLWCVAATLTFLRKADDDLRELYEREKTGRTGPVRAAFTPEVWSLCAHPDEDRDFSALFVVLGPVLAGMQAVGTEQAGLRPEERVTASFADTAAGRALKLVANALGSPPLQVFARNSERRPLRTRVLRTSGELLPTLLLGAPMARADLSEASFVLTRQLVLLRPERMVCALESGRTLARVGLEAALALANLKPPSESTRGEVERMTAELEAVLPPVTREHIVSSARRLIAKHGGAFPDVDRWCNAVELSAARAAFLMVSDLVLAARVLAQEAAHAGPLSAKQRLRDLVGFSISERYFEARALLGLGSALG